MKKTRVIIVERYEDTTTYLVLAPDKESYQVLYQGAFVTAFGDGVYKSVLSGLFTESGINNNKKENV